MSTAGRRSGPNERGFEEQRLTEALPGSRRSLVHDDWGSSEYGAEAPLFISDPLGRPQPEEYARHDEDDRTPLKGRSAVARLVAVGLAIVALGGAGAVFYYPQIVGSIQDTVSDKAVAASAVHATLSNQDVTASPPSNASGKTPAQLGDSTVRPSVETALPSVPGRETMKAAYQNALQSQPQAALPQAPDSGVQPAQIHAPQIQAPQIQAPQVPTALPLSTPAAAPQPAADPVHPLAPDQIASLIRRGDDLIGSGDVAAARLVLRRAAEAGDARAMIKLGATYDPALLSRIDNHGVAPDLMSARGWYEKAAQHGAPEARRRLEALAR